MWLAVACLIVVSASPTIKIMEGQYKLVGPQRPSTHGQLFASLPITRNLIFSGLRIEVGSCAVRPSKLSRPNQTAKDQNLKPILSNGPIGVSAREQRATSQSLATSIAMNGCAGPEPTAGSLEMRNEDQSAVASASIWVARAWHWQWRVRPKEARHARQRSSRISDE